MYLKVISEQVSHHPPMVAQHCDGRGWRCWQEFTMSSKFRGKYLQVIPLGEYHLEFDGSGQSDSTVQLVLRVDYHIVTNPVVTF